MTFPFVRDAGTGLLIVSLTIINKFRFNMVLDTGATNTTIDTNALHLYGYDFNECIGKVLIETANGIVETEVYEIDNLCCLGIEKNRFPVQVYDFLAHGIFSDYEGLLGLDFFEGTTFSIDMKRNVITIEI